MNPATPPSHPEMQQWIESAWSEILGLAEVDPDMTFMDLGGTSLLANQMVARFEARYGIAIPVLKVFEHPTLRQFVAHHTVGARLDPNEPLPAASPPLQSPFDNASANRDIAIVGMAARVPGADDLATFWQNLEQGRDTVARLSPEELGPEVPASLKSDPKYVRARGMISDPYGMDAQLFNLSALETKLIDPQHRVLLETAWHALEDAGHAPGALKAETAVFVGVEDNTYYKAEIQANPEAEERAGRLSVMTGNEKDFVALRLANRLNLKGPAISVNTACSTSLVAVIMAAKALRDGDCEVALAGGASVHFPTHVGYTYQEGGIFSHDGRCQPFDHQAGGTIFTDGVGVVVLKRLEDAIRDGNPIRAVIKGGAINNDGGDKISFSAPSIDGQAACILKALRDARVQPDTIQYVEAHGTATLLGDPIEVAALTRAYRATTARKQFCGIGSVKSNIGHTTTAAGVVGLIKTVLSLEHRAMPATVHYTAPNPRLELEETPFFVVDRLRDWPREVTPRRAAVSSFGLGGTNSHLIVEEAPPTSQARHSTQSKPDARPFEIIPVSANSKLQRDQLIAALGDCHHPARDLAYTFQTGRARFPFRGARIRFPGRSPSNDRVITNDGPSGNPKTLATKTAFLFPGQGSQYAGMGKMLFDHFPEYRENFLACCQRLTAEIGTDFQALAFDTQDTASLQPTQFAQPALFAIEYALGKMLLDWGFRPDYLIGHSIGEFAAATLAGVMPLEDALRLIAARGRLMAALPPGAMLSVRASVEQTLAHLGEPRLDVAAINGPTNTVLAGPVESIANAAENLAKSGIPCKVLHTSHAFHSSMMDPALEPFLAVAQTVRFSKPSIPIISTLTGTLIGESNLICPEYWAKHLRSSVRFGHAVATSVDLGTSAFFEIGPRSALSSLVRNQIRSADGRFALPALGEGGLHDSNPELEAFAEFLARVWAVTSVELPWDRIWTPGRLVSAPNYPLNRRQYRFSEGRTQEPSPRAAPGPTAPQTPRERLRTDLKKLFSDFSGADVSLENGTFIENGFDSLLLIQVGIEIGKRFGASISLQQLMKGANTLDRLTDAIEVQIAARSPSLTVASSQASTPPRLSAPRLRKRPYTMTRPTWHALALDLDPELGSVTEVPASDVQREIFGASRTDPDASRAYNNSISVAFHGQLDVDALSSALQHLLQRHEALRGTFSPEGDLFRVHANAYWFSFPTLDWRNRDDDQQKTDFRELLRQELDHLFDLVQGPLFRCKLVRHAEERWTFVFNCHHAVVDGWSLKVILEDLSKLYGAYLRGDTESSLPPVSSFVDFVRSENEKHAECAAATDRFWRSELGGGLQALAVPLDFARPGRRTYHSRREDFQVDRATYDALCKAGAASGCSAFMSLLATFGLYWHRTSGNGDFAIGVPVAGQVRTGMSGLMGHDAHLLPIRCELREGDTFSSYATRIRDRFLQAYDHHRVSLPQLIQNLGITVQPDRVPLVPVMFNFDPGLKDADSRFEGLQTSLSSNSRNFETFEISINAAVDGDRLVLECAFNTDLFEPSALHARLEQWQTLIHSAANAPHALIQNLEILPAHQKAAIDRAFVRPWPVSSGHAGESHHLPDHELWVDAWIAKIAHQYPDRNAAEDAGSQLTYADLWQCSGQIAAALQPYGSALSRSGLRVGVMMEPTVALIPALVAVWRAGGTFVPLDPLHPDDRLKYQIETAEVTVVLTSPAYRSHSSLGTVPRIIPEDVIAEPPIGGFQDRVDRRGEDPAYILFTSGTTGRPKGVSVPHRALYRFLQAMSGQDESPDRVPGIREGERVLAHTSLSFDIAQLELWLPLVHGATTVIADRATATNGPALAEFLTDQRISFVQATPSTWRMLLEAGWTGHANLHALSGGEPLDAPFSQKIQRRSRTLWNVYGPTETTIWSTIEKLCPENPGISIGRPLLGTFAYVVDAKGSRVPPGVLGELWIGGVGVSHGYIANAALNRDRFIPNPFGQPGLVYRTGDLVRMTRDLKIEYVGRQDGQIKIRGYRVELGEIETHLREHPEITDGVVRTVEREPGDLQLVAYYTTKANSSADSSALRRWMEARLPAYMVPNHWVRVESFPKLVSGKRNLAALPNPFNESAEADSRLPIPPRKESPVGTEEEYLAQVWRELLGVREIGRHDRFTELGGHSLLVIRAVNRIRKEKGIEVSPRNLFHQTLEEVARVLAPASISPLDVRSDAPPSGDAAQPVFFGRDPDRPIFGVFHAPRAAPLSRRAPAVLLCPSLGQESMRTHRFLRTVARRLADRGASVLRFDYFGQGDSYGRADQISLNQLTTSLLDAAEHLKRASRSEPIQVIGLRAAALIAGHVRTQLGPRTRFTWIDPAFSGAGYLSELRRLQIRRWAGFPFERHPRHSAAHEEILGCQYSRSFLNELETLEVSQSASDRLIVGASNAAGWDQVAKIEQIWQSHDAQLAVEGAVFEGIMT